MTLTFVPLSAARGNSARSSLHPLPHRVDHPAPLLLLADHPQLGQGGQELSGRGVGRDQDAGAGGGVQHCDHQNVSHVHDCNLDAVAIEFSVCVHTPALNSQKRTETQRNLGGFQW